MYLSSFNDVDHFNSFLSRFNDPVNTLSFDKDINCLVSLKDFNFIRSLLNQTDQQRSQLIQEYFQNYSNDIPSPYGDIESYRQNQNAIFLSTPYHGTSYRLFPYSKTKFLETFMADMLPSFKSDLYSYLTDDLFLFKQIGSGSGSSIIVKVFTCDSEVLLKNINSQCSISSQVSNIKTALSSIVDVLEKQNLDISYMNQYISQLESTLLDLSTQLEHEKKQGVNGFYRTWH